MRGHYKNEIVLRRSATRVAGPTGASAQQRQYQSDLNQQADLLFWSETHYKVNQRLDPHDPADRHMIPTWHAARARVERSMSPQALRRSVAARAAFDDNARSGLPYYVFSSSAGSAPDDVLIPFSDVHRAYAYARDRLKDSDYVAYFDTTNAKWPDPVFEEFPPRAVA